MIILKSICLKNFLSHADSFIEFQPNTRLLINGISGSGKSSVIDSILWVMYGKGRTDNRNLIKTGKKYAEVLIKLVDTDANGNPVKFYNIERRVTDKGKQTVEIAISEDGENFKPAPLAGLKETQEYIERSILRSSYMLFINSVACPQDNQENFVKQTAANRKELLLEIANVGEFDTYYEKAKDELALATQQTIRSKTIVEEKDRYITENKELAASLDDLQKEEESIKAEIVLIENGLKEVAEKKTEVNALALEVMKKKTEVDTIKNRITSIKESIAYNKKRIEGLNTAVTPDLENKLIELEGFKIELAECERLEAEDAERQSKLNSLIANKPASIDYDKEIDAAETQLKSIVSSQGTFCAEINRACPTMVEKMQPQVLYYQKMITDKQEAKRALTVALAKYETELSEVPSKKAPEGNYNKIVELRKSITQYQVFVNEKEMNAKKADLVKSFQDVIDQAGTDLMLVEMELPEKEGAYTVAETAHKEAAGDPVLSLETSFNENLGKLRAKAYEVSKRLFSAQNAKEGIVKAIIELEEAKTNIKGAEEKIEELTLIKEAFGSKGIKLTVIDYILPTLEEKTNEILGKLSDFRVEFNTQKSSANGESTIDGVFVNVIDPQGDILEFNNYSGSEKMRISFSISEGLASLQKCNFRILDEAIHGLDAENEKKFVDILSQLQSEVGQVLTISHLQGVKDIFEEVVTVTKANGDSVIN